MRQGNRIMKHSRGFTLIELMVTIAIVAILAAIALPTFTEQVRKSRRSEALQGLTELQLRQERWRSNHATYFDGTGTGFGSMPSSNNYTFAITNGSVSATAYTVTATPIGAQSGDRCGTYSFAMSNGTVTKTVSSGASNCSL